MNDLGKFEITFLKAVEKLVASVPSVLSPEASSIWRSTLLDTYVHLSNVALLVILKINESN